MVVAVVFVTVVSLVRCVEVESVVMMVDVMESLWRRVVMVNASYCRCGLVVVVVILEVVDLVVVVVVLILVLEVETEVVWS